MSLKRHEIYVLRLGHRYVRDRRTSTHVGLVARAFGAKGIYYSNVEPEVIKSVRRVIDRWGGHFDVKEASSWKKLIQEWKKNSGTIVHLTMYGERLDYVLRKVKRSKRLLVVVGAEKVPPEVYKLAEYNVAIGSQPHSEVAALAVFLDRLFEGKELDGEFENAKVKVIPSAREKRAVAF